MSEDEQGGAKKCAEPEKPEICTNPLLCPEEWEERPGEKVLGEYHKHGPAEGPMEEADLASFEKYWSPKSDGNLSSEYHKEGRPHLHEAMEAREPYSASGMRAEPVEGPKVEKPAAAKEGAAEAKASETPTDGEKPKIERPIDIHTIEVMSYAIVRALFSQGITVPIKREDMFDMELRVRGKDIIIDTKQLYPLKVPDLVIWRVIYAYKGKPVAELGRGVKKGFKIHAFRGLVMLVDMWRGNRRQAKMLKASERAKKRGEVS